MRAFFDRMDALEPWAWFWTAVVYLLCIGFVWSLCRAAALADRAARRIR